MKSRPLVPRSSQATREASDPERRGDVGFTIPGVVSRSAKEYASERASMGKTIDRHEMIAEYLETKLGGFSV